MQVLSDRARSARSERWPGLLSAPRCSVHAIGLVLLVGRLGEHVSCNLVAVERSRGTGVGLNVDEKLDDLLFGDAIVECNSQLSAQRFMRAQYRCDRHRDQCAAAGVQARSRPGISKRMPRGSSFEVGPNRRLSWPER